MSKKELRQAAEQIQPSAFLDAKDYLGALYKEVKACVGQYSYIRFTEDLGFGACNAMYLIVHGKRRLTRKGAEKIAAALGLTGVERRYLVSLAQAHSVTRKGEREAAFERLVELKARAVPTELDRQQLEFYNEWHHAVILELLAMPDASDDPAWIAASLTPAITALKAKKSLALLKKLGHVAYDKDRRRLAPTQAVLSTGGEVVGMAVMRYHQQMIGLAKDALTDVDPFDRDVSAVTIAMPAARMDELKARLQAFRKELLAMSAEASGADRILQINLQLFPVARALPSGRSKKNEK